ncbi:hypothetical protein PFISCL1PPCAC_9841, partial [Pristionchus fissidentatus]
AASAAAAAGPTATLKRPASPPSATPTKKPKEESDEAAAAASTAATAGSDAAAASVQVAASAAAAAVVRPIVRTPTVITDANKFKLAQFFAKMRPLRYSKDQLIAARLPANTVPGQGEQVTKQQCAFCLSFNAAFGIPEESKQKWLESIIASLPPCMKSMGMNIFGSTRNLKTNRVCARHFRADEMDDEGVLDATALPRFVMEDCAVCKEPMKRGGEVVIHYEEQIRLLTQLPYSKRTEKELRDACSTSVQFACPSCFMDAILASPDSLSTNARTAMTQMVGAAAAAAAKRAADYGAAAAARKAALPTVKNESLSPAKRLATVAAAAAAARASPSVASTAASSDVPMEDPEELARDWNSARRQAVVEPPTPASAPRPISPDFAAPETPATLLRTLSSAMRHAHEEPPTPASALRPNSPDFVAPQTPALMRVLSSAMRHAVEEPPTPAPTARPPSPDVIAPPTPAVMRDLNSAMRHAVLEPPTPAAPVSPSSRDFVAPAPHPRQDDDAALMDRPPETPADVRMDRVNEIRQGMMADFSGSPSTSRGAAAPTAPSPAAAGQRPNILQRRPVQPTTTAAQPRNSPQYPQQQQLQLGQPMPMLSPHPVPLLQQQAPPQPQVQQLQQQQPRSMMRQLPDGRIECTPDLRQTATMRAMATTNWVGLTPAQQEPLVQRQLTEIYNQMRHQQQLHQQQQRLAATAQNHPTQQQPAAAA